MNNKRVATIEVKNNTVVQVKAKYNQKPPKDALNFVKEWAKEKMLNFDVRGNYRQNEEEAEAVPF